MPGNQGILYSIAVPQVGKHLQALCCTAEQRIGFLVQAGDAIVELLVSAVEFVI